MWFAPLEPQEPRPIAFITNVTDDSLAIRTFTDQPTIYRGTDAIVTGILNHCEYHLVLLNESTHDLCRCGDPRLWTLYAFNGQPTRVTIGPISIYPLNGLGGDPLQLEPFYNLLAAVEVRANAPSTTTRDLWRRTLLTGVEVRETPGEWGRVGRRALRPGRRETRPGSYRGVVRMDLPAAFPRAMSKPLPMRLVPARPGWYDEGIARAVVEAPRGVGWSMLPGDQRLGEGFWTFEELRTAAQYGHGIILLECWRGSGLHDSFGEWFRLIQTFRGLPGVAGQLGKLTSNKLWGTFTLRSRSRYTRTSFLADGTPMLEELPMKVTDETAFLSVLIAGRVNALLYEGLQQGAVACDTDCVIVPLEIGARLEVEGWVRKEEMTDLEIVSQRAYRYKCMQGLREHSAIDGCVGCYGDRWHYVVQGFLQDSWEAEEAFEMEAKWKSLHVTSAISRGLSMN